MFDPTPDPLAPSYIPINFEEDYTNLISHIKQLQIENEYVGVCDLVAIDHQGAYPQATNHHKSLHPQRFELIYILFSYQKYFTSSLIRHELQIYTSGLVPSLTELLPSLNWYEREVFDMFGIEFSNHPNLTRILNEEELEGFPLRRDFDVLGYYEYAYEEAEIKKGPITTDNRQYHLHNTYVPQYFKDSASQTSRSQDLPIKQASEETSRDKLQK